MGQARGLVVAGAGDAGRVLAQVRPTLPAVVRPGFGQDPIQLLGRGQGEGLDILHGPDPVRGDQLPPEPFQVPALALAPGHPPRRRGSLVARRTGRGRPPPGGGVDWFGILGWDGGRRPVGSAAGMVRLALRLLMMTSIPGPDPSGPAAQRSIPGGSRA